MTTAVQDNMESGRGGADGLHSCSLSGFSVSASWGMMGLGVHPLLNL